MNWIEIKKFLKYHIANSPFSAQVINPKDISEPITKAVNDLSKTIQGKRNDIVNPEEISDPIVEAQERTIEAVREIKIPQTDLSTLEDKLEALLESLEKKEMTVNVGKTEIDLKSVIKAIEKIKLEVPKMEKQEVIDYTLMFDEMMKIMEAPRYSLDLLRIQENLGKLSTTEDMVAISGYLQTLIDKPQLELPDFKFNKEGRLKVEVDRAGGGGGASSVTVDNITQTGFGIPLYDTQVIDESGSPALTTITYQKNGATVATKTITVAGTTTTISVT